MSRMSQFESIPSCIPLRVAITVPGSTFAISEMKCAVSPVSGLQRV